MYWSRRTLDTWRRFTQQRRRSLITWLRVVVGSLKSSSEGEPLALRRRTATVTLALNKKKTEILPDPVVLERTPRQDSRANLAERATRTLEEQVKVSAIGR